MSHEKLSDEADDLRKLIVSSLIQFSELTGRPDQIPEWVWFNKKCYQHDVALIKAAIEQDEI